MLSCCHSRIFSRYLKSIFVKAIQCQTMKKTRQKRWKSIILFIINCLRTIWPKGYQRGSLRKSHQNGKRQNITTKIFFTCYVFKFNNPRVMPSKLDGSSYRAISCEREHDAMEKLHYRILGPSSLPVVVAQPDERLTNGTQIVLCIGMVRQTQHTCLYERTTEPQLCWMVRRENCHFHTIQIDSVAERVTMSFLR